MPSLVELIFSAIGTDAAASAVDKVSDRLGDMTRELGRVATAGLSAEAAFEGIKGAIEDGAMFERLSGRIGETVRNTVILDQAFRNAKLGTEYIGASANLLQRALGGVNDMGIRTDAAFVRLGTSIAQLKPLSYAEQIQVLTQGFSMLGSQSERANVAMQLFGRGGGQMLQLFGNPNALNLAEAQAGRYGDRLEQDAEKFHQLEEHLGVVNLRLKEMWVTAAEQLLPSLEQLAGVMGGMNFSSLGAMVGAGAPDILGAGLASMTVKKLDTAVMEWATMKGNPIGQTFAGEFIAPLTGALSSTIPLTLGAAVAAGIIQGIFAAYLDGRVQALVSHEKAVNSQVEPYQKMGLAAGSSDAVSKALSAVNAKIASLDAERAKTSAQLASDQHTQVYGKTAYDRSKVGGGRIQAEVELVARLGETIAELKNVAKALSDPHATAKIVADNQLAALKASLEPLVATLPQLKEKEAKGIYDDMSPSQKAAALQSKRTDLEGQLASAAAPGLSQDEVDARRTSINVQLLQVKHEQMEVAKDLTDEANKLAEAEKKQADEAQKQAVYALETKMKEAEADGNAELAQSLKEQIELKQALYAMSGLDLQLAQQRIQAEHRIFEEQQAQKVARQQLEAEKTALENNLTNIRENLAALEGDYSRTSADKWEERKKAIDAEIATLKAAIQKDDLDAMMARVHGDDKLGAQYDQAGAEKRRQLNGAQREGSSLGPDPNSVSANLVDASRQIGDSMGTVAQQVAKAWQSAAQQMRSGMAGALYDMLEEHTTFRREVAQLGAGLAQDLARSGSQMAADWVMQHVIMDAARRLFNSMSVAQEAATASTTTAIHAGGEAAKTGATAAGAGARSSIRIGETIIHGIQVVIRVAAHIAGEILQTATTLVQSGIRIAAIIAESVVYVIKSAVEALSALASIPYVGPILGIAAMAAVLAAGTSLISGASHREMGGDVQAGRSYIVGEKRPELFVPKQDGYIFPDVSRLGGFGGAAAARQAAFRGAGGSSPAAALAGGGSGGAGAPNVHIYLDKSAYLRAIRADMTATAHEVYDQRERS